MSTPREEHLLRLLTAANELITMLERERCEALEAMREACGHLDSLSALIARRVASHAALSPSEPE